MALFKIIDSLDAFLTIPDIAINVLDKFKQKKILDSHLEIINDEIKDLGKNEQIILVKIYILQCMEKFPANADTTIDKFTIFKSLKDEIDNLDTISTLVKNCISAVVGLPVAFANIIELLNFVDFSHKDMVRLTKFIIKVARTTNFLTKSEKNFIQRWKSKFNIELY